jgi:hypothetical protein
MEARDRLMGFFSVLAEAGALWKLGFCANDATPTRREKTKPFASLSLRVCLFSFATISASKNLSGSTKIGA